MNDDILLSFPFIWITWWTEMIKEKWLERCVVFVLCELKELVSEKISLWVCKVQIYKRNPVIKGHSGWRDKGIYHDREIVTKYIVKLHEVSLAAPLTNTLNQVFSTFINLRLISKDHLWNHWWQSIKFDDSAIIISNLRHCFMQIIQWSCLQQKKGYRKQ